MQYKVLALDLDGTLTNTEKVITPRTKAALQEAARRGVCIVLASGGYPGKYESGKAITGLADAEAAGATVYHAGTKRTDAGYVTAGGRVLGVTATGDTLKTAIDRAYDAARRVRFDGMFMRSDIGKRALEVEGYHG